MESIFNVVWVTSLYGTVVGIALILIKNLLKNRLSPKWHYLIWIVLILKLLIPFGPESAVSLFNIIPVTRGRKMTVEEVKRIADGRILSAKQALELNLIDEIATYDEVKEAFSAELGNVKIYTPKKKDPFGLSSLFSYINSLKPRSDTEIIAELIKAKGNGVPMYYAMPGQY